jgi:glycerol kinase
MEEFAKSWRVDKRFEPAMEAGTRDRKYGDWRRAVQATIGFAG